MRYLALLIAAASSIGCTQRPDPSYAFEMDRRRAAADSVKLPETTPFDDDLDMRGVYLNYYWFGYQDGVCGGCNFIPTDHPWYEIQWHGYIDGALAGFDAYNSTLTQSVSPNQPQQLTDDARE